MMVWLIFEMVWWVFMSGGWREEGWDSYLDLTETNWTADSPLAFDTDTKHLSVDLSTYVPYTGATTNVNLGTHSLTTTGDIRNNNSTNFSCFESGSLRIGNDPSPFPSSYIKFLYNTISNYLDVSDIGSANGVNFDVPIKVGALHSNGFLKTVGSDGSLTVDTSSYLKLAQATPQTFTSGTVTGTGLLQVVGGVLGKNVMITVSATAPTNPNIGDLWVDLTE
jgi:hypothetical protein